MALEELEAAVFGAVEIEIVGAVAQGCSFEASEDGTENYCYKDLARECWEGVCLAVGCLRGFFCWDCLYTSDDLLFCSNT